MFKWLNKLCVCAFQDLTQPQRNKSHLFFPSSFPLCIQHNLHYSTTNVLLFARTKGLLTWASQCMGKQHFLLYLSLSPPRNKKHHTTARNRTQGKQKRVQQDISDIELYSGGEGSTEYSNRTVIAACPFISTIQSSVNAAAAPLRHGTQQWTT